MGTSPVKRFRVTTSTGRRFYYWALSADQAREIFDRSREETIRNGLSGRISAAKIGQFVTAEETPGTGNHGKSPQTGHTHCTQGHEPGQHNASCMPPADPTNPELRLLRTIFGLCPVCDNTEPHEHEENFS